MGQSAFGEIAVTVSVDPDVQHSGKQLELFFLFPDSTVETVLVPSAHCYQCHLTTYSTLRKKGFRDIFNCNKAISQLFQKCDVSIYLLPPPFYFKIDFWTFQLCCMNIVLYICSKKCDFLKILKKKEIPP